MTIAEKITRAKNDLDEVYTAGYEKGKAEVIPSGDYSEGFTAGKQAEYDAFWDVFQSNGNRTNYSYGFGGEGWTKELFKPKYDMYIDAAGAMFYQCGINGDIAEICANAGVKFDTSKATNFATFAGWSLITRFGEIDTTSAWDASLNNAFYACYNLHTIDKLILKSTGTQTFVNTLFYGCTALKNITIEGTIGKTISFADSPLTADSAISVITHLKSFYEASDAYSQTLTFSASTWAALDGLLSPANTTWRYYVEQELAWNT